MTLTRENQRTLGVHRFKMLLRVAGVVLLAYTLIVLGFIGGWGENQGSFLVLHFTLAAMFWTGAGFAINAWVSFLGTPDTAYCGTLEKTATGLGCLTLTLLGGLFFVLFALGVIGVLTW